MSWLLVVCLLVSNNKRFTSPPVTSSLILTSAVFVFVFLVMSARKLVVNGRKAGPGTLIVFATLVLLKTLFVFVNPITSPCCPARDVLLLAYLILP